MATIRDPQGLAVWRDELLPANFDGFPFHVDAATREAGRRIHVHQFPKKELPYAEDMGHEAVTFTVRGYIIVYPHDEPQHSLYRRDYRIARDYLIERLDRGGPGVLQLPSWVQGGPTSQGVPKNGPVVVVCTKYKLTEEEKNGGYCVIDMQFVERGVKPFAQRVDPLGDLYSKTYALRTLVRQVWARETEKAAPQIMGPFNPLKRFIGPPRLMRRYNPLQRFGKPPYAPITQTVTSPPKVVQTFPGGHSRF